MAEESKPVDPKLAEPTAEEDPKGKAQAAAVESDDDDDDDADVDGDEPSTAPATGSKKKKKSKKKKLKEALLGKASGDGQEAKLHKAIDGLTPDQISQLLELNPALAGEIAKASGSTDVASAADALKRLKLQEIMTGLAASGKNVKDMGNYKFWSTQPVTNFGEAKFEEEGPIKVQTVDDVPKEPSQLLPGFEWCTVNVENPKENEEVRELLQGHYVEDDEALFRFNYSYSILKW
jgi:glycylpeptide N-tetradecanoyltransferase